MFSEPIANLLPPFQFGVDVVPFRLVLTARLLVEEAMTAYKSM